MKTVMDVMIKTKENHVTYFVCGEMFGNFWFIL